MPMAPLHPCSAPGCSVLVRHGRCARHAVDHEHARPNYETRRWYRTLRWKVYRRAVLNANPLCVICQTHGVVTVATEVDHIRRHFDKPELFWNLANLQGLCRACHVQKTMRGE
jgi:5-methylcytosine-specific restriction enzyme A